MIKLTMLYDDQRDGNYQMRFLIGSALSGGKALEIK